MNKFIQHVKEEREGFSAKAELVKNPNIFEEIANEFSSRFKNKFNNMRDNLEGDNFISAKDKLAEMSAEMSKMYELVDILYKQEQKKPVIEITDEMEDALYNTWGIHDLNTADESEAIRLAKDLYPGVNGLVISGVFYNFCIDNDPDEDEDDYEEDDEDEDDDF